MSNTRIRPATVEDAPVLAAAQREITKIPGRLASLPHEINDDAFRAKIAALADGETGRFVVIESNGDIVGHALLEPFKLEVTAHVADLTIAVHEGHQGKGFGTALMTHLIEWARSNPKLEKITLHVRSSNRGAIALYERLGFVVEGVRVKFIKLGPDAYLDNVAMALWVGP